MSGTVIDLNQREVVTVTLKIHRFGRHQIETTYYSALARLADQIAPYATASNPNCTSIAWKGVNQITKNIAQEHSRLAASLEGIVRELVTAKGNQKGKLDSMRGSIKHEQKDYYEMKQNSVPKLKSQYFKRTKELAAEKEDGPPSQKNMKMQKEFVAAEQGYRKGVIDLEDARYKLALSRDRALSIYQDTEFDRIAVTKTSLIKFREAESRLCAGRAEAANVLSGYVDGIQPEVDMGLVRAEFGIVWPPPAPVLYEHYQHGPSKDMVFGVPLHFVLRNAPPGKIPIVLSKCLRAIEARGLDKEGIYRVPGKHTDVNELKNLLEKEVTNVNLDDEKWEVNVIAALVKLYLRSLPVPLFPYPQKERVEHSQISNEQERAAHLQQRVRLLSSPHYSVLKALIEHLALVASHSSTNKMTVQNLALIFGPVVFQGQPENLDAPPVPEKHEKSFWGKAAPSSELPKPNLAQYEFMKQDGVLEDLIHFREFIFSSDAERGIPAILTGTGIVPLRVDSLPDQKRLSRSPVQSATLGTRTKSPNPPSASYGSTMPRSGETPPGGLTVSGAEGVGPKSPLLDPKSPAPRSPLPPTPRSPLPTTPSPPNAGGTGALPQPVPLPPASNPTIGGMVGAFDSSSSPPESATSSPGSPYTPGVFIPTSRGEIQSLSASAMKTITPLAVVNAVVTPEEETPKSFTDSSSSKTGAGGRSLADAAAPKMIAGREIEVKSRDTDPTSVPTRMSG
ncbi:hypothetical protein HK104_002554 [Borealophlyctis nickersoniae]|nr:hypothetical protein HK104_002554 [Borealophlyctis nickersoniae]